MVLGSLRPPCETTPEEAVVALAIADEPGRAAGVQAPLERWHAARRGPFRARWGDLSRAEADDLVAQLRAPSTGTRGLVFAPADGSEAFVVVLVGPVVLEASGAASFTVSCELEERLP